VGEGLKFQRGGGGGSGNWQLAMFDLGVVGDQIIAASKLMVQAKPMIY
jgi:hypothetical protein